MNVFITGGTKGIGLATALRFAQPGNKIFMNYSHDDQAAKSAEQEVVEKGASAYLLKYDVGDYQQVEKIAYEISEKVDSIDLIVHCAVGVLRGDALEITPEDWRKAVEISSLSLIDVCRELRPLLKKGSSIVALSSKGATNVLSQYAALGTTKAFTESIIRYLAVELAPYGIRANVVSAGPLDTEAFRSVFTDEKADRHLAAAGRANPSGRNITFEDVTDMIAFLASPGSQMVQGRVMFVDGGLSLK